MLQHINIQSKHKYLLLSIICIILLIIIIISLKSQLIPFIESFQQNTIVQSPTFTNFIAKFIYINLDKRDDRKTEILLELKKINIPDDKIQRIAGVYIPKNGHKGCIQSHILALKLAQMNNWDTITIFEDDAQLVMSPEETINIFNKAISDLTNEKWDVLMLSTANKKDTAIPGKQYINKLNFATTGTAYMVNSRYYSKMIMLFEYCNAMMPNDKWGVNNNHEPYALDQKWMELQERDNWFCTKQNLFIQRNSKSTTNAKGND